MSLLFYEFKVGKEQLATVQQEFPTRPDPVALPRQSIPDTK